mgnify:CR=1 FL=1
MAVNDTSSVTQNVQLFTQMDAAKHGQRSSNERASNAPDTVVKAAEQSVERVSDAIELSESTISPKKLADLVEKLRQALPATENSLQFRIDEVLDRPVVSVIDEKSGAVIRQLPSDEVVRAAHNIEYMRGVLFDRHS